MRYFPICSTAYEVGIIQASAPEADLGLAVLAIAAGEVIAAQPRRA